MKMKLNLLVVLGILGLVACTGNEKKTQTQQPERNIPDTTKTQLVQKKLDDTLELTKEVQVKAAPCKNDSLDELAKMIAGINYKGKAKILWQFFSLPDFKEHHARLSAKWNSFDTSRLAKLKDFQVKELATLKNAPSTLFYPFSGPDILYAKTFFPNANKYILMGLEPVGTLPVLDNTDFDVDSLKGYFHNINSSLQTILQYSFFRTESMSADLKTAELDGTIHLLLFFLARTANTICEVNPVIIDTSGNLKKVKSFVQLKKQGYRNKGVEIKFMNERAEHQSLYYFSVNLADASIASNKGLKRYMEKEANTCTYLKGASYLMHKNYFSQIREIIFSKSAYVIQDDSGIAWKYFEEKGNWEYQLYGKYIKPIPLFASCYQKDLDSLYKLKGSTNIGFGLGYNFKDKNSNFMIAKKVSWN